MHHPFSLSLSLCPPLILLLSTCLWLVMHEQLGLYKSASISSFASLQSYFSEQVQWPTIHTNPRHTHQAVAVLLVVVLNQLSTKLMPTTTVE